MPLRTAVPRRQPLPRYVAPPQRTAQPGGGGSAPAPPAPPSPVTPGAGAGADYSGDPILAQIRALYGPGGSYLTSAQGSYDEGRKRELINYGYDASLDSLYPDAATKAAAQANPYSILNQLSHANQQRETNLNEGYNKQNLFYSGHRGQALGENARAYGQEQYGASQGVQNVLRGLAGTLAGAQSEAQNQIIGAEQAAAGRATDFALQYGLGGGPPASGPARAAVASSPARAQARAALLRRYGR